MPHRERYLFICVNRREAGNPKGSCATSGSEELVKLFKEGLLARGLAKKMRACSTSCLDLCEFGASVVQEPEHIVYGRVTPNDVGDILDALVEDRVCERLVVRPPSSGG